MKKMNGKFEGIGNVLDREQMKNVSGGKVEPPNCGAGSCPNSCNISGCGCTTIEFEDGSVFYGCI